MLTIIAIILMPLIGLGVAGYLAFDLMKQKAAEEKAKIIAAQIKNGATIFLFKELKILAALAVLLAVIMALWPAFSWPAALAFLIGVIIAGLMAFIGVKMATIANVRTAEQAGADLQNGLSPAFSASAIMGLIVVSLGLLGSSVLYLIFKENQILYVFVFGLSLAALFLRIGGGIFTKSADVSADIVGKLEAGVAEDDLRNPVVIADNVGDIAGDFIGAGADWLSSYAGSLVAAVGLGLIFLPLLGSAAILLPFLLGGAGLMAAALGILLIKFLKFDFYKILNKIIWLASIFMAVISFFIIKYTVQNMGLFWSFLIGLFGGLIICLITEYYTSEKRRPTKALAEAAQSGPSINIIAGLSLGFFSVIMTTIVELAIIYFAYKFGDIYGLALASLGLLSVLGINLAVNTFGPMVDNAAGIVEMAGMSPGIRKRLAEMDASGNTRAAMGKGLAMASATLVALVFLFSFMR
ncbi:MAG: sodium/proton-translocating pyrophosphatase, partial [Patescibacteria group bacterium]